MKLLSILGISAGAIFTLGSFVRYYVIYQDLSEMVVGMSIGLLFCGFFYLFEKFNKLNNNLDYLEEWIADNRSEE